MKWYRELIVKMAHEKRTWGSTRIPGALSNLGYQVCEQTIEYHLVPDFRASDKRRTYFGGW